MLSPVGVLGVVLHRHGHAFDRAGALAGVAAGAERLVDIEVPEQDGEGAVAVRQAFGARRVLDGDRLAEEGPAVTPSDFSTPIILQCSSR